MMPRLSAKDEQLLSEYLDGRLSARETADFEKRLKSDEGLRQAAADLRRLKVVLRSAPRYPLPRNFTLTPEMVRKPGYLFWLPVFRFASAAAVFLLAAAFLLELVPGGGPALRANQLPAMAPAMEAAPAAGAEAMDAQASPPPIIVWNGAPAAGRGGGAVEPPVMMEAAPSEKQMDTAIESTEQTQALIAPAEPAAPLATPTVPAGELYGPQPTPVFPGDTAEPLLEVPFAAQSTESARSLEPLPSEEAFSAPVPAVPEAGGMGVAPTQEPFATQAATMAPESDERDGETSPSILGIRPTAERAMLITPEGLAAVPSAADTSAQKSGQEENTLWFWIKLALAAAALSTGTAAVILQRKARK